MTSIVLPGMSERKKGAIINVSSASGALPTPFLSLYSATKSFVDFFSEAVKVEYAKKGVIVQVSCALHDISIVLCEVRPYCSRYSAGGVSILKRHMYYKSKNSRRLDKDAKPFKFEMTSPSDGTSLVFIMK